MCCVQVLCVCVLCMCVVHVCCACVLCMCAGAFYMCVVLVCCACVLCMCAGAYVCMCAGGIIDAQSSYMCHVGLFEWRCTNGPPTPAGTRSTTGPPGPPVRMSVSGKGARGSTGGNTDPFWRERLLPAGSRSGGQTRGDVVRG